MDSGAHISVVGVPSAAGAYGAGVARAPAAIRQAGLIEGLRRSGLAVHDSGDLDLDTPRTTRSGILDAMGIAHMLGVDGSAPSLRDVGGRSPLIEGRRIAAIGYDELELGDDKARLADRHGVHRFGRATVEGGPGPLQQRRSPSSTTATD